MRTKKSKICIIIAIILIVFEIVSFVFLFTYIDKENNKKSSRQVANIQEQNNNTIWLVLSCIPMVIIPAAIIALISEARTESRIKKHENYLKAINPSLDLDNLDRRQMNAVVSQLDYLANEKTGFLTSKSINGKIIKTATAMNIRNEFYQEHLQELMNKHPEIDFNNMSKRDKEIINDELDAMIYAEQ